jgi:hypothetical protein
MSRRAWAELVAASYIAALVLLIVVTAMVWR